jgi:hypothetical protein
MKQATCPVGRPVGVDQCEHWAWSAPLWWDASAPTFTPTRWAQ